MGQIYIPIINWFLLAVCVVFVCCISSIDEIGNAYGNSSSLLFFFFFFFFFFFCGFFNFYYGVNFTFNFEQ